MKVFNIFTLYLVFVLLLLNSCRLTHVNVFNRESNKAEYEKSELFSLTNQARNAIINRDIERLVEMVDYDSYIKIDRDFKMDSVIRDSKKIFKLISQLKWEIVQDKGVIDSSFKSKYDAFFYMEVYDNRRFAYSIYNDDVFFFKKNKRKWIIFYYTKRQVLKYIDIPLNETQVKDNVNLYRSNSW